MFEGLGLVPWGELHDAYGWANEGPKWIRALDSQDYDLRSDAVNHFLWSCAFHQYTLYPVTPFVIPFVIEALQSRPLVERDCAGHGMKAELLHFVRMCAEGGQRKIYGAPHRQAPTIESAVLAGARVFEGYASDADPAVAKDATWLVSWCKGRS